MTVRPLVPAGATDPDRAAFDPARWRDDLVVFARKLGARADAEDIVQEAMLRAIQSPPSSNPRAYLYRTTLNVARDRIRRREHERGLLDQIAAIPTESPSPPDQIAAERELARSAQAILLTLPERQRIALLLRVDRGLSYDDIGLVIECTAATARQHVHLGLRAVRQRLEKEER